LRSTVATGLQRPGVRLEVTEAVLNHKSGGRGGIAGVYQRDENLRDIFNSLPKQPGTNGLCASQAEVLEAWFARRTDRDVVVKLDTGGRKTLVALLMTRSRS
jgi:superfamily II DNA or RNA helicase